MIQTVETLALVHVRTIRDNGSKLLNQNAYYIARIAENDRARRIIEISFQVQNSVWKGLVAIRYLSYTQYSKCWY